MKVPQRRQRRRGRGEPDPRNEFWCLGPNVTGYPGGFPNGFLERVRSEPWWGTDRLHVCAGSVDDGTTVDVNPRTRPDIVADGTRLPIADEAFDTVLIDPPYSRSEARDLYGTEYPSPPELLEEGYRVLEPGGHLMLLHRNVFMFRYPPANEAIKVAMVALYGGGRGPTGLRALQVLRKPGTRQVRFSDSPD